MIWTLSMVLLSIILQGLPWVLGIKASDRAICLSRMGFPPPSAWISFLVPLILSSMSSSTSFKTQLLQTPSLQNSSQNPLLWPLSTYFSRHSFCCERTGSLKWVYKTPEKRASTLHEFISGYTAPCLLQRSLHSVWAEWKWTCTKI